MPEIVALLVYCQNAAGRVIGAKPATVCRWIFTLLGACPGDTLDDLSLVRMRSAGPGSPYPTAQPVRLSPHHDAFAYRGRRRLGPPAVLILVPSSSDRRLRRRLGVV
jgi:hypothetical protein